MLLHLVALAALVASDTPPAAPAPAPAAAAAAAPATAPATTDAAAPADAAPPPAAAAPATSPLPPPQKPRLLVMDLVDKGAGADVTNAVNQAVQGQAVQSHLGETVTATQVKLVLDASAQQRMLGCESENCMADVGKIVDASIVMGGSVAKVGPDFLITLMAINEKDGTRIAQQQRKVPANRELYYYAAKQLASLVLTGRAVDPRVPVVVKINEADGDGTIIIDGNEVATGATFTAQLDPGSHEIRVRKSGKAEWKTIVNVEEATPLQVTADLVDTRIALWPVAAATGGATVIVTALALGFGMAAQDDFDGSIDFPGYDNKPAQSYSLIEPVDSEKLFTLQKQVDGEALTANILYATAGVLGAATVGLLATDLVLNATSE